MVVVLIGGVVKLLPVPRYPIAFASVYQFTAAPVPVAPSTTVPVPQRVPGVVPVIDGTADIVRTAVDEVTAPQSPVTTTS